MHTNTLRVILQHTMDNVVSRYVLAHDACVRAQNSAVYRRKVQRTDAATELRTDQIRSVNKAELESVTDS